MLGDNLKRIRLANGYSQAAVAARLHVTRQTVSSWETNRTEPTMGNIEMLAKFYGCKKSELLEDNELHSDTISESENAYEFKYVREEPKKDDSFFTQLKIRRCNLMTDELLTILGNMTPGRRLNMLRAIFTLLRYRYVEYDEDDNNIEEDIP